MLISEHGLSWSAQVSIYSHELVFNIYFIIKKVIDFCWDISSDSKFHRSAHPCLHRIRKWVISKYNYFNLLVSDKSRKWKCILISFKHDKVSDQSKLMLYKSIWLWFINMVQIKLNVIGMNSIYMLATEFTLI